jgi:uncharacterized membrane protein YjfL (UPF0719 family)
MEWQIIALNVMYTAIGIAMMYVAYKLFDFLTPQLSFQHELKAGNVAVAIFIGSMFLAIGMIIAGALN